MLHVERAREAARAQMPHFVGLSVQSTNNFLEHRPAPDSSDTALVRRVGTTGFEPATP
jgi:hypothetical protein